MKYDLDHFIAKFDAIDDEYWTTQVFRFRERRCALGHCGVTASAMLTGEGEALCNIRRGIMSINDGSHPDYPQPTPRARVLCALLDLRDGKR